MFIPLLLLLIPYGDMVAANDRVFGTAFFGQDIVQKKFSNVTTQVAAILIPTGSSSYNSMLAQPEHGMSIYTRLFYLDGHGLTHFEKFSDRRSVTGVRIIVWKVNWEGGSPRIAYNFTSTTT